MTLATAVLTDQLAIEDADDDLDHIVCCNDDITLCGRYLPGDDFMDLSVEDPDVCEICANKERIGAPCTVPGCPKSGEAS